MRWFLALAFVGAVLAADDGGPAREHFLKALSSKDEHEAQRHYVNVLREDPAHRAARRALAGGGRSLANEALKRLRNRDERDRAAGLVVLSLLEKAERERAIRIALSNPNAAVRAGAVTLTESPATLARAALDDRSRDVRSRALRALKGHAHPARHVAGALGSPLHRRRLRAIETLGDLGDRAAVGPLVRHLFAAGGSGQRVYIARTRQTSVIKDFDVEVA